MLRQPLGSTSPPRSHTGCRWPCTPVTCAGALPEASISPRSACWCRTYCTTPPVRVRRGGCRTAVGIRQHVPLPTDANGRAVADDRESLFVSPTFAPRQNHGVAVSCAVRRQQPGRLCRTRQTVTEIIVRHLPVCRSYWYPAPCSGR